MSQPAPTNMPDCGEMIFFSYLYVRRFFYGVSIWAGAGADLYRLVLPRGASAIVR